MKYKLILKSGIAGVNHHIDEDDLLILNELRAGQEIILKREPDNRFDHWAIAIYTKKSNILVGYVSRYKNEVLARLMDQGVKITAFMTSASKLDEKSTPSPTENMRYPFSVFLLDDVEMDIPEIDEVIVNYKLIHEMNGFYKDIRKNQVEGSDFGIKDMVMQIRNDLIMFLTYLSGSDGKIVWQEAEFFDIYLHEPQSTKGLKQRFVNEGMNRREFYKKIPKSLEWLVNHFNKNEDTISVEMATRYYRLYEALGNELISCDQEVTEEEKAFLRKYLKTIKRYCVENLKGYQTEEIKDSSEKTRRIIKKTDDEPRKIIKKK